MNRNDIIRMAREAGFNVDENGAINDGIEISADFSDELKRFAVLVATAEREACAEICDQQMEWGEINTSMAVAAGNCADLIRARGQG